MATPPFSTSTPAFQVYPPFLVKNFIKINQIKNLFSSDNKDSTGLPLVFYVLGPEIYSFDFFSV